MQVSPEGSILIDMKRYWIMLGVLILVSIGLIVYAYPLLPHTIVTHWNASGIPNGYSSRLSGLLLFPLILIIMGVFAAVFPTIDPLKKNVKKFLPSYEMFLSTISLFLIYLEYLVIRWNMGHFLDMTRFVLPGVSLVCFAAADLVAHAKRNWFIGIRTPWTIQNEIVWEKTHALGAVLFRALGGIYLLESFMPRVEFAIVLGAALLTAFVPVVYSYTQYRALEKKKHARR